MKERLYNLILWEYKQSSIKLKIKPIVVLKGGN